MQVLTPSQRCVGWGVAPAAGVSRAAGQAGHGRLRKHSSREAVMRAAPGRSAVSVIGSAGPSRSVTKERQYNDYYILSPAKVRRTERREIVRGQVWLFEQTQGILEVIVNIRMTVVKLRDGGLFVHAPVAPTAECLRLLAELPYPVRYIVLPTTAVEHKIFFGPFCKKFPAAKCYSVPGQWSFPLNLPLPLLGLYPRKLDGVLTDEGLKGGEPAPWASDIDQAVLATSLGIGPFVEAAFYHRASRSLLVTDIVVSVPQEPPSVCAADPQPLLIRAKPCSTAPEEENTAESRRRGWQKTILFALFFQPGAVSFSPFSGFTWADGWRESFSRLAAPKLLVPPILQILVLSKRPVAVSAWVDRICRWNFVRIIPAHLRESIDATPSDFRAAFDFLPENKRRSGFLGELLRPLQGEVTPFGEADSVLLRTINAVLLASGTIKDEEKPAGKNVAV